MKPVHHQRIAVAREQFALIHPGLFDLERPVPFAVGISDELRAAYPAVPRVVLKGLFWWLTRRRAYLESCKTGVPRFGLNGVAGTVSEREAMYARKLHAEQKAFAGRTKKRDRKAPSNQGVKRP